MVDASTRRGLMTDTRTTRELPPLLAARRKEIIRLAARHGARNVRVYGSIVRGDARSDSDVDILVDLEPGRTLLDLGGLQMDLQDLLRRPVDLNTTSPLRPEVRERVADQAIAV